MAHLFQTTSCSIIPVVHFISICPRKRPQVSSPLVGLLEAFAFSPNARDAETSQTAVQWQRKGFAVPPAGTWRPEVGGLRSSWKRKCSAQVSPIKAQGWLHSWYLLDGWEAATKQTVFLITRCTIFLPHVSFIMVRLFKATWGKYFTITHRRHWSL